MNTTHFFATADGQYIGAYGSGVTQPVGGIEVESAPEDARQIYVNGAWMWPLGVLASFIRAERDRRLAASDRFVLPDYPHADAAVRQAWLDYRQALRDLPEQAGFPWNGPDTMPWPEQPAVPTAG